MDQTPQPHTIVPGRLDAAMLEQAAAGGARWAIDASARAGIEASVATVRELVAQHAAVYGINTGFGKLAQTRIADDDLAQLQKNLVLSHSAGVGQPLAAPVVRLMLLLKAASLAHGVSGVRPEVIDALLALLNADVLPVIPEKGSVGASGDLAPLAHLAGVLIGVGEAFVDGVRMPAAQALAHAGLAPLQLGPKEGLALLNGTQASTALAIHAVQRLRRVFDTAVAVGAMTVDAAKGSDTPFDDRIHAVRGQRGQRAVATPLPRVAGRQRAARLAPRLRPRAGPVLPALPAAGDGRVPRPDRPRLGHPADRGERRVRQPARVLGHEGGALAAATSTPSRSRSRPTTSRSRSPRSARSPSAAPRC